MAKSVDQKFEEWKRKVRNIARVRGADDIFDDGDPYGLVGDDDLDPATSFNAGMSPRGYVRSVFAEDFASEENDREMVRKQR